MHSCTCTLFRNDPHSVWYFSPRVWTQRLKHLGVCGPTCFGPNFWCSTFDWNPCKFKSGQNLCFSTLLQNLRLCQHFDSCTFLRTRKNAQIVTHFALVQRNPAKMQKWPQVWFFYFSPKCGNLKDVALIFPFLSTFAQWALDWSITGTTCEVTPVKFLPAKSHWRSP